MKVVVRHFLVEYHIAIREVVERLIRLLLEIALVEQRFEQDVAVLGRDQRVRLTVYEQHGALDTLHHLEIIEMLLYEHAQKFAGHVHGHILHCCVRAHQHEATGLVQIRQHARRTATHRSSEEDHVLAGEAKATLTSWLDNVVE